MDMSHSLLVGSMRYKNNFVWPTNAAC